MVPLKGGGLVLFPSDDTRDIAYLSAAGAAAGTDSFPWSGFRKLEYLARGIRTAVDRVTGRWAAGFIYGNGWFTFDSSPGSGSSRRFYIEPTRFPPVIKEYDAHGGVGTGLVRTPGSALDLALRADTLFVLFDGQEPDRRRKLDLYGWKSGTYLGSIRLPDPADLIGVAGHFVAVYTSQPVPTLTIYRRGPVAASP
jgi:hypothetical protein